MIVEIKLCKEDRDAIINGLFLKMKHHISVKDITYTAEETAELLKVHKNTVFNYIKSEALKATKKGKKYVITQDALNEFLEQ